MILDAASKASQIKASNMAAFDTNNNPNNWHNGNRGGGLPFRPPPTVDEALPYSPFTSVVPFSPGEQSSFTSNSLYDILYYFVIIS